MGAGKLDFFEIGWDHDDFLFARRSPLYNLTIGGGDKGLAPEFDALLIFGFALGIENDFVADAVGGADVAAVGDCVGALRNFP